MTGSDYGYGPPKIHGYTVTITGAAQNEGLRTAEVSRSNITITLHGEGFMQRAMPLIVKIGEHVVVRNYEVTPDQCHLTLHLDGLPEDGTVIQVGYGGQDLVELPERFSRSKAQEGSPAD